MNPEESVIAAIDELVDWQLTDSLAAFAERADDTVFMQRCSDHCVSIPPGLVTGTIITGTIRLC